MAENLAYLPSVNTKTDSSTTVAKYYVYNYNDTSVSTAKANSNYTTYGTLYNWSAASNACLSGWHLPTRDEWLVLENYVGGLPGMYLKATSGWESYSKISNEDSYGFSALPGGYYYGSDFDSVGFKGAWWTAMMSSSDFAYYRGMDYASSSVSRDNSSYKYYGYSVRCVKDD